MVPCPSQLLSQALPEASNPSDSKVVEVGVGVGVAVGIGVGVGVGVGITVGVGVGVAVGAAVGVGDGVGVGIGIGVAVGVGVGVGVGEEVAVAIGVGVGVAVGFGVGVAVNVGFTESHSAVAVNNRLLPFEVVTLIVYCAPEMKGLEVVIKTFAEVPLSTVRLFVGPVFVKLAVFPSIVAL